MAIVCIAGVDTGIGKTAVAELLLSQGKKDKAVEIYTRLAEKKGVTPFVAKRLKQLNIAYKRIAAEGQNHGVQ